MKPLKCCCFADSCCFLILTFLFWCSFSPYVSSQGALNANSLTRLWEMSNVNNSVNKPIDRIQRRIDSSLKASSFSASPQFFPGVNKREATIPFTGYTQSSMNTPLNVANQFGSSSPWIGKTSTISQDSSNMQSKWNSNTATPIYASNIEGFNSPAERFNNKHHVTRRRDEITSRSSVPIAHSSESKKLIENLKVNNDTSFVNSRAFKPEMIPIGNNQNIVEVQNSQRSSMSTGFNHLSIARSLSNSKILHNGPLKVQDIHNHPTSIKNAEHPSQTAISPRSFYPSTLSEGFTEEARGKPLVKKKYRRFMLPLLLAYKLKFFTLIPLLMGGLVLLAGSTGLAGFFFALFAAVMGLKSSGNVH